MCNNLICTKCNSLMNTHTLYNVDDDIKYIQNEINISKNINDGRITELKGFELKRRGELKIIKI